MVVVVPQKQQLQLLPLFKGRPFRGKRGPSWESFSARFYSGGNLVKAYKSMEEELRLCYEEYSRGNKQMVDASAASSASSNASAGTTGSSNSSGTTSHFLGVRK
ncbi:hypothetical protein TYRP_004192 [Tyrophagus putrescentiae]|nr:hypothetical protein TYRP_004192 [Tyrophagus putrescentiae]